MGVVQIHFTLCEEAQIQRLEERKLHLVNIQVMQLVKNSVANAGDARDTGLIPGLGRSPGGGNGNPAQYSCLENSMDRGPWWGLQSMGSQRIGHD